MSNKRYPHFVITINIEIKIKKKIITEITETEIEIEKIFSVSSPDFYFLVQNKSKLFIRLAIHLIIIVIEIF